jgi:hypothetical protein
MNPQQLICAPGEQKCQNTDRPVIREKKEWAEAIKEIIGVRKLAKFALIWRKIHSISING